MSDQKLENSLYQEALNFHQAGKAGKIAVKATKPLTGRADLSLAYSPGVAAPCLEIHKNPDDAYKYTAKGNFVAVISNGTAVLGLGNLGALASKPVMEGKAVLFKRFADIDAIDIEVDTQDPDEFINAVKYLGPSWGGINLEDIKAPECFIIESKLRELMDIPVFHDDQHGTAIITLAALINAADISGRKLSDMKVVVNGAGAAAIACIELIKASGVKHENVILCDTQGVIYRGRKEGVNQWKAAHASETKARTLKEAIKGADVFLGLSVKGAVTQEMVKSMNKQPIIFAMANPDPEITPEEIKAVRPDAIIATGRSDYNNQVNNVMGFPYIFRGALDVQATTINDEMKIAAAKAIAQLAREPVPEEVSIAYPGHNLKYGPDYIIPVPFDPRLIYMVPPAVAKAAEVTKVARRPIDNLTAYEHELKSRLDPTASNMNLIYQQVKNSPKRIIFAEGEEESVIKAALHWAENEYGRPILIGREKSVIENAAKIGINDLSKVDIVNAHNANEHVDKYIEFMYKKLQRSGYLHRDCARMVKNDRNIFAACMLALGHGDGLVSGIARSYRHTFNSISTIIDAKKGEKVFALSVVVINGRTVFIADTRINEHLTAEDLATISMQAAQQVKRMGHSPRLALLSYSNFGDREFGSITTEAVKILDKANVDFEYEGEISADVAMNIELMKQRYPFSRLSAAANVLIMPSLEAASISAQLLVELGGGAGMGPIILGLEHPVQIAPIGASMSKILNLAAFASIS